MSAIGDTVDSEASLTSPASGGESAFFFLSLEH
jgi:hypothetical protein